MSDQLDQRPSLPSKARRRRDSVTGEPILLFPEGVLRLNPTGASIVALCDGQRTLQEIVAALSKRFAASPDEIGQHAEMFLAGLDRRGLLKWNLSDPEIIRVPEDFPARSAPLPPRTGERPLGLLAELTYRCPLGCPYCSNPTVLRHDGAELTTEEWKRVLAEAADLGALHVHLSGGEPLLHRGLPELVKAASRAGLYTNLLTSGIPFARATAEVLRAAGLDHVQLSLQSDEPEVADAIAGRRSHAAKLEAARLIRELRWPLTINVVLHRRNIQRLPQIIALAEELDADRLELANVQFYGWAHQNRSALLPDIGALKEAAARVAEARVRLRGRLRIDYILPDVLEDRPKPCMEGWGRRYLTVNPQGDVLPCPTASCIESLQFENVRNRPLHWIWHQSESFNRFRGTTWMPEPCRSCEWRHEDFGGCRCQAALITGNAANTDPACGLSPHRSRFAESFQLSKSLAAEPAWSYRKNPLPVGRQQDKATA
jgi:pyrroloquinoline quinone biosynthesis protein E